MSRQLQKNKYHFSVKHCGVFHLVVPHYKCFVCDSYCCRNSALETLVYCIIVCMKTALRMSTNVNFQINMRLATLKLRHSEPICYEGFTPTPYKYDRSLNAS